MPGNVLDENVVILRFDNSDFEKNTKKSMESLDKLKNSLNEDAGGSLKGLSNAVNSVNLSGLGKSIDTINSRFSTLGIAGAAAINKITSSMMSSVTNIATAVPRQMIQGGWKRALNIEQATYLMKGLGVAFEGTFDKYTGEFEGVKGAVLAAVNDTRYGLDEAAKAAATLIASGVKDVDELANRLKSISGVAAVTSSEYNEIASIFTKVAGQGRMMGDELNQLSNKGFNAAAEIKDYLNENGKIKQQALDNAIAMGRQTTKMEEIKNHAKLTENDVRDMVSAGAISFEIMSDSLLHFFDTAAGANSTFEGSLANVKAALSRMGAQVEAVKLSNLTKVFNYLLPVLKRFEDFIEPFTTKMNKFSTAVTDFIGNGIINPIGKALGMKNTDLFHGFADAVEDAGKKIDDTNKKNQKSSGKTRSEILKLNHEYQAARDIWYKGTYGNGQHRKNALEKIGISYQKTQAIINQFYRDGFKWDKIEKQLIKDYRDKADAADDSADATNKESEATDTQAKKYPIMEALLKSFINVLASAKLIFEGFKNVIVAVAGVIRRILTPGVKTGANVLASLTDKLLKAAKRFNEFSKAFKEGLSDKEWREKHKIINALFTGIGVAIKVTKDIIVGFINTIKEFFSQFSASEGFEALKEQIKDLLPVIRELASGALQKVLDGLHKLSGIGASGTMNTVVGFFSNLAKGFATFIDNTRKGINPLESFIGIFKKVKDSLSFGSIFSFSFGKGAEALSSKNGLVGSIANASISLKNARVSENFGKATNSVMNFFSGLSKMAPKIDFEGKFDKLLEAFTNADWNKISNIAFKIGSLAAIFKTVKDMGKLTNAAIGTLGSLSGVFKSLTNISNAYASQIKVKSFTLIAISVAILVGVMVALATIPVDRILVAVGGLLAALGIIVGVMAVVNSDKFDSEKLKDVGKAFLAIGGSLLALALACKVLSTINGTGLLKATVAIAAFIGGFILVSKLVGDSENNGKAFIGMATAIDILLVAIGALAIMPWAMILKGSFAIGVIMLELSLAARLAGSNKASGFVGMANAINILIPAILMFSVMPFDKAMKGATTVALIIAMIGLASRTAGSGGKMGSLISLSIMVTALTGSLVLLSMIDGKRLAAATAAISATVLAISLASAFADTSKKGALTLALVVGVISASIYALLKIDADGAIGIAKSLSILALSLSAAVGIFSLIGVKGSLLGLAGLAIAIGGISAIIMALGGIAQIPGAKWLMKEGKKFAKLIGEAIGTFVGSIVGSFGVAATSGLPQMGANLSAFMEEIKPFVDMASDIDASSTKGIQNLANAIVNLTKAEFLDQLSFLGGSSSIENFAQDLTNFAQGFVNFSTVVDTIPDDSVDKINKITKIIARLAEATTEIPKSGGIAQAFTGWVDIESFIDGMIDIAKALGKNGFSTGIADLKIPDNLLGEDGKITKIAEVITTLANATKKIPKSGGVQQGLTGNTTLAEFGEQLGSFAVSFGSFADDIDLLEIPPDFLGEEGKIAKICSVITAMVTAAKDIPDSKGVSQFFTGNTTINEFAYQLAAMVPSLKYFIDQIGGEDINLDAVKKIQPVAKAVKYMALAAQEIPETGGVKGLIFGGPDLGKFARQLAKFIPGFQEFASGVGDLTITDGILKKIPKICQAIGAMAQVSKALPKSGGWAQKLVGEKNLGKFGAQLKTLIESLQGVQGDVDVAALKNAGSGLSAIVPAINEFREAMPIPTGENLVKLGESAASFAGSLGVSVTKGLSKKASAISDSVTELGKAAKKGAKSLGQNSGFKAAGKSLGAEFASGISSKKKDANTAGSSLGKRAVSGAKSKDIYNSMLNGGKHVANGFVKGIKDKKQSAYDAGYALGRAAKKGQKDATKESSPAKEFIKGGRFAGEGLVIGLKSYNRKAYKAGYQLGDQTVIGQLDGITHAIDDISDPVITPVIDLSQVERGFSSLENNFSRNSAVGVNARFEAADVRTNNLLSEVAKTIDKLNNQNQANNYYNITVDGAENPEEFANRFLREVQLEVRTG